MIDRRHALHHNKIIDKFPSVSSTSDDEARFLLPVFHHELILVVVSHPRFLSNCGHGTKKGSCHVITHFYCYCSNLEARSNTGESNDNDADGGGVYGRFPYVPIVFILTKYVHFAPRLLGLAVIEIKYGSITKRRECYGYII